MKARHDHGDRVDARRRCGGPGCAARPPGRRGRRRRSGRTRSPRPRGPPRRNVRRGRRLRMSSRGRVRGRTVPPARARGTGRGTKAYGVTDQSPTGCSVGPTQPHPSRSPPRCRPPPRYQTTTSAGLMFSLLSKPRNVELERAAATGPGRRRSARCRRCAESVRELQHPGVADREAVHAAAPGSRARGPAGSRARSSCRGRCTSAWAARPAGCAGLRTTRGAAPDAPPSAPGPIASLSAPSMSKSKRQ